jgi:Methyl-accepting chemotaxis protein
MKKQKTKKQKIKQKRINNNKINLPKIKKESFQFKIPGVASSLRFKLIGGFLIPIIFIILLGIVSFQKAAYGIRSNYEKTTSQVLNMTGNYINFGIRSIDGTAIEYINDKSLVKYFLNQYKDGTEKEAVQNTIKSSIITKSSADEFIENIYFISDIVDSLSTDEKGNMSHGSPVYSGFMETQTGKYLENHNMEAVWEGSDAYLDEKLGTKAADYSLRLVKKFQNCKAMIVIDVRTETLENILKNIKFDKSALLGVVMEGGKEIGSSREQGKIFSDKAYYKKAVGSKTDQGTEYVNYQGKEYLFMYSKIGKTGAMICAMIPKATIVSQADGIRWVTVIIVIIACLVAILIGIIISVNIDRILQMIIKQLKKAAKGDLTVEFSTTRKDEFKVLSDEIQNTFVNMKNLIRRVNELGKEVSESSSEVNHTSTAFLKSTEDISNAIREIEQGISQQAMDAEECLIQMDSLSQKIAVVSNNAKEITQITGNTKADIVEGTGCTQELNQQMKATTRITKEIIKAIELLEEKSNTITNITNVINDIANQTNLLSLNASIEAARAGEHGKGFAVVATEIRNLADESKEAVNGIQKIINSIQEDTRLAVKTAREAETVLTLQENAVDHTTVSYEHINDSVENLMVHLGYISENVDRMEDSRVSTLKAIENISAVLEEIAASINTVSEVAAVQTTSVEDLNESAEILSGNADELLCEIQKFAI